MAWNKPGGDDNQNGSGKDPWTGRPKTPGAPDLEQAIKKAFNTLKQLLAGKAKLGANGNMPNPLSHKNLFLLIGLMVIAWITWGIYVIEPTEQGIVLRFGKYVGTVDPGMHWSVPLVEKVYPIHKDKLLSYRYNGEMLTNDENIVSAVLTVQYKISDPRNYLFNVVKPQDTLQQAAISALQQALGKVSLEQALATGSNQTIAQATQNQLNAILNNYNTGLTVSTVSLQPLQTPDAVKNAFDDVMKAQEEAQRDENAAQAYALQVEPLAKEQAQQLLTQANAYQQQVVAQAKTEIIPFLALLPAYQQARDVTRERLYLETLESIYANSSKIMVDSKSDKNVFSLPLKELLTTPTTTPAAPATSTASETNAAEQMNTNSGRPSNLPGGY